jgi:hypothetical protein
MNNKKVLSTLVRIASNQQAILNKLAQAYGNSDPVGSALSDFVKYQFTSWAMPKEIQGRLTHSVESSDGKNYDVNVTIALTDPSQKSLVEDPANGFAAWLNKKLATAPSVEKWKALAGCSANFNVTA